MDPFLGEVRLLPYNFAPAQWLPCEGQLLPIVRNTTLYSLIGTMYGGDGKITFALPDLRGRAVVGAGQGPGLQNWAPGTTLGSDSVTLETKQIPVHSHAIRGIDSVGTDSAPTDNACLAQDRRGGSGNVDYLAPAATVPDATMDARALGLGGGTQAHENRQPFLGLQYCIAIQGIFPQRP